MQEVPIPPIFSPKSYSNERFFTQKIPYFSPSYLSETSPVSCLDELKLTQKPLNLSKKCKIPPQNIPVLPP